MNISTRPRYYKYLAPICMIFITVLLCDILLVYRLTKLIGFTLSGGIFVLPLYYVLLDIVAEVYGYQYARQMIWLMLICSAIFATILTCINSLPSPPNWHRQNLYHAELAHIFRVSLGGGLFAMMFGAFSNSFILSKWKIKMHGRYFWLRSIGSSAIGEFIQNFMGAIIIFYAVLPFDKIIKLIFPLYFIQVLEGALLTIPATFIVAWLKRTENIYPDSQFVNYNPFKITIESDTENTTIT